MVVIATMQEKVMIKQIFKVEEKLDYLLGKSVQVIKTALCREFKANKLDITTEQWSVLAKLNYEDGVYQKQIGDCLFKDKPTITRILDLMEKKNLIIRMPDDKDRRKSKIYLTKDGKDIANKLAPISEGFQNKLTTNITREELENFTQTLEKISKNISG